MTRSKILRCKPPSVKTGTCEMCGAPNCQLRMLSLWWYNGWTCEDCITHHSKGTQRKIIYYGEQTEPCE